MEDPHQYLNFVRYNVDVFKANYSTFTTFFTHLDTYPWIIFYFKYL